MTFDINKFREEIKIGDYLFLCLYDNAVYKENTRTLENSRRDDAFLFPEPIKGFKEVGYDLFGYFESVIETENPNVSFIVLGDSERRLTIDKRVIHLYNRLAPMTKSEEEAVKDLLISYTKELKDPEN